MSDWQPIDSAPFGRKLELSVIEDEVHALAFPCYRAPGGWVDEAGGTVQVDPTHWRRWRDMDEAG